MKNNKTIKDDYPMLVFAAEEGGYVAEIPTLKGCLAQGDTLQECLEELELVKSLWLETARMNNEPLPDADKIVKKVRAVLAA